MSSKGQIPNTPRVISPSPTPSETSGKEGYFPPTTRSKQRRVDASVAPIEEHANEGHNELGVQDETHPDFRRARSRSRSPQIQREALRMTANGGTTTAANTALPLSSVRTRGKSGEKVLSNGSAKQLIKENDLLSPASAVPQGFGSAYWRNLSRSPSPFGLIPVHREWRAFVHKHEIPRKALHVSIGFLTLFLYHQGFQTNQIHPVLLGLFIPIFSVDLIRFQWPEFNRVYIRYLGAFMRESEAHDRFNGVISYIGGLWLTMYFCRKDVAVVCVLLLSWCDTAASTFGRLWGKYTPRIRRGKSLAGSIAAFTFGVASAVLFWGVVAPKTPEEYNMGQHRFSFQGTLTLPKPAREYMNMSIGQATIGGHVALAVMSLVCGFVASFGEAIDLWGLDDNLTIPALCGLGLEVFLWAFGGS
ncbi:CTP_transf_1-domain-containing protein [Sphaerulina musiva SO2202]|uniref:CTP_transf_1-domain-containing protein n=1 Tax=Sphaerulina musiva (strain SO2202) TaxID=692275 RepID=M3CL51_SPHMS|nr:CTP_transf_1-domain-containing protein [Sphaerulina musiva SO2202]EMF14518.1 CTP_transf_1-domain-containing protein [Sphaerulina musiva SO2202]